MREVHLPLLCGLLTAFTFIPFTNSQMKQADKKASTFIAPTSVELVDNAVVVKGINSATGKPYTCTY